MNEQSEFAPRRCTRAGDRHGPQRLASVEVLRRAAVERDATDEKAAGVLGPAIEAIRAFGARFVAPAELEVLAQIVHAPCSRPAFRSRRARAARRARQRSRYRRIEVAYRLCKAPIIAMSGTKGKSTTTALVGHICAGWKKRSSSAATSAIHSFARRRRQRPNGLGGRRGVLVSARNDSLVQAAHSVLLNISPDHLDRYDSMDEYIAAKFRIFENQAPDDTFVGNLDDRTSRSCAGVRRNSNRSAALWFTDGTARARRRCTCATND